MSNNKELEERLIEIKMAEGHLIDFKKKEAEFRELKNEAAMFIAEQKHQLREIMVENDKLSYKYDGFCDVKIGKPTTSIEIIDMSLVPDQYLITKITSSPDKFSIKQAIENLGKTVPGVNLKKTPTLKITYA